MSHQGLYGRRISQGWVLGAFAVFVLSSQQHTVLASMWRPECDEACPELMNHFHSIDLDPSNHTGVKWKCRIEMKKCVACLDRVLWGSRVARWQPCWF